MPPALVFALFSVLAFLLALAGDFLETKYVRAVHKYAADGDRKAVERAARCSVAMWLVGVAGLIACVEISWYLILPEGAGLYIGTKLALRG